MISESISINKCISLKHNLKTSLILSKAERKSKFSINSFILSNKIFWNIFNNLIFEKNGIKGINLSIIDKYDVKGITSLLFIEKIHK